MLNINNHDDLITRLEITDPLKKSLWGKMTFQHIVEHLTLSLQISTGKKPQMLYLKQNEADEIKLKLIYSEGELPMGIKSPLLGEDPPPLVNKDPETAIANLRAELSYFNEYYQKNANAAHIHPRFGLLNYHEWKIIHGKHFTHHFKQLGLV